MIAFVITFPGSPGYEWVLMRGGLLRLASKAEKMVGAAGLEPATPCAQGRQRLPASEGRGY